LYMDAFFVAIPNMCLFAKRHMLGMATKKASMYNSVTTMYVPRPG
jgi:hypothetical protein